MRIADAFMVLIGKKTASDGFVPAVPAKKCPFCGSPQIIISPTRSGKHFYCECAKCGTSGPLGADHFSAISAWNDRTDKKEEP